MDLRATLAINLPTVENTVIGAVEQKTQPDGCLVFKIVIFSDNSLVTA